MCFNCKNKFLIYVRSGTLFEVAHITVLDIIQLSNGSIIGTLHLMKEGTEKLYNYHTQINKLKVLAFYESEI